MTGRKDSRGSHVCQTCGKQFLRYGHPRFCCRSCWKDRPIKGSIWLGNNGYLYVDFGRKKRMLLHRYLLGVTGPEVVHHKDGNPMNNDLTNLQILLGGQSEHIRMHNPVRARWGTIE